MLRHLPSPSCQPGRQRRTRSYARRRVASLTLELARAREAIERARAAQDQCLVQLSHDLRNPLAPIVASLTLIRRTVAPSSFLDRHLDMVERQVQSLTRIVDGIVGLSRGAASLPAASPAPAAALSEERHLRRILVVDDNEDAADSLAELVQTFGYETQIALDGPAALAVCQEWSPELVFLDIGLPGMSGYDVARELRKRDLRRPVLVALTGYGQESDRRRSRDAGFALHIVKPPSLETLEGVLSALEGSPAPHPARAGHRA